MDRRSVLLALAGGAVVAAQTASAQPVQAPAAVRLSPGEFRRMALMGGEFAIQTSRLALERSRNPRIRNFAELEIEEQIAVAASLGATPGGVPLRPDQAEMLQRLASTPPGPRFDAAYVRGQIMGHEELLQVHSAYAQGGSDPVGRATANVAVPSIKTHLTILSGLRRGGMA